MSDTQAEPSHRIVDDNGGKDGGSDGASKLAGSSSGRSGTPVREIVNNLLMTLVLAATAWWAYGQAKPLIFDDSIDLPLVFDQTPVVEDHLPDNYVNTTDFELAKSRMVGTTPAGARYWLLASSESVGKVCLYVETANGTPETACATLAEFGERGVAVSLAGNTDNGGDAGSEALPTFGLYLAEGMEVKDPPVALVSDGLFAYAEGTGGESLGSVIEVNSLEILGGKKAP